MLSSLKIFVVPTYATQTFSPVNFNAAHIQTFIKA